MEPVELRRMGPDDWRTWRDVRLMVLADEPGAFWSNVARERAYDEARWRHMLDPARGRTTVAYAGSEPVGTVCGVADDGEAVLTGMWVARSARGTGVADLLVRDVSAWAAAAGFTRLTLWHSATNDRARRFYERAGFVTTEAVAAHPDRPGELGHQMTSELR